jgi:hypothetical protein
MDPHLKPIDFVGSVLVCMLYISCVYSKNEFVSDPRTLSGILAVHWIYIQLRVAHGKKKGRRLENH